MAGKVPRRPAIGKQVGDEGLGTETGRPPPVLIKRRAGKFVRRDDIGTVEDLAGRIACDARQHRIGRRPVDKAAHDFRIGSRRVHIHEPDRRVINSEHDQRPPNGVANLVQDVWPELCVEGRIVDRPDKIQHLVIPGQSAA